MRTPKIGDHLVVGPWRLEVAMVWMDGTILAVGANERLQITIPRSEQGEIEWVAS